MSDPTNINLNATLPAPPTGTQNIEWQTDAAHLDPNDPTNLLRDVSAYLPPFIGDGGSGGLGGAVPEPAAGTAAAGKYLKADGTWEVPPVGAGTVTSVALTMPAEFNVAGSPVTSAGTLAVTKANESANQVYAGPASGSAAAPTFRALVAADLPTAPLVIGFVMSSGATGTNVGPMLAAPRAGTVSKCKIVTKASDPSTDLTIRIKKNGTDVFSSDPTVTHGAAAATVTTSTSLTSSPLAVAADDVFSIDITSGTSNWIFSAQLET